MPDVTIPCPECLRAFPQALCGEIGSISEAECVYCRSRIHYAVVPPIERPSLLPFQQKHPVQRLRFSAQEHQSTEEGKRRQDAYYR